MKDREYSKEQLIKELEESSQTNKFLSLLLESMPVAVYTCEAGGDFGATYISNNITALTGYKPADFTSNSEFWFENVHPADKEMVNINITTLLATGHISYEYRWRVADGSYKWFYDISRLMKSPSGDFNYIVGTFIDITERKKTEEALKINEEKYRLLFSTEQDAIIIVDADTRKIVDANDSALRLYGYSKHEILTLTGPDLSAEPEKSDDAISKVAMSNNNQIHYHARNHKKRDGTFFPVEISSSIFILNNKKFISAMIRDITERKRMEEKLRAAAITDDLTGLLNRRGFFTLADQQCKLAVRIKRTMALVYIDLDGLKKINDELGHEAGDHALEDAANIFKKTFRESDIIARIGGDEFAVLLTELSDPSVVNMIVKHLQENIKTHNEQGAHNYELSVTTGMAHYDPEQPCSISKLLNQADKSMYNSKKPD